LVLDCALKWTGTELDRISVVVINAALEVPDWTGIRSRLDALTGKNNPARRGIHVGGDRR
jgi:hypothetical protein